MEQLKEEPRARTAQELGTLGHQPPTAEMGHPVGQILWAVSCGKKKMFFTLCKTRNYVMNTEHLHPTPRAVEKWLCTVPLNKQ